MQWLQFSVSLPYWLPTSGMVAAYLMCGMAMLLWSACHPKEVLRRIVARSGALAGLVVVLAILFIWPLKIYHIAKGMVKQ